MIRAADVMHELVLESVSERDARWFADRPSASWYTRPAVPHEVCVPGLPCRPAGFELVRVTQLEPGLRARQIVPR